MRDNQQMVMVLSLLEQRESPNSFWKPYLDSLPDKFEGYPFTFQTRELELLQNSSFVYDVQTTQEGFRKEYLQMIE